MFLMDVGLWATEMGKFRVKQRNHLYSFPKPLRDISQVGKRIADICIYLCLYLQSYGAPDSMQTASIFPTNLQNMYL